MEADSFGNPAGVGIIKNNDGVRRLKPQGQSLALAGAEIGGEGKSREAGWWLDRYPVEGGRIGKAKPALSARSEFGNDSRRHKDCSGECGKKMKMPDLVKVLER